ncbi:MAG: type II toxin-antitoxin system RelE/ParE family toxin [Spirochaetota bacterium]
MRIRWVPLAFSDLENIAEYISKDSTESAQKVLSEIWRVVNLLESQPNRGHSGRVIGTRELYVFGTTYIVPYRIKNEEIQILRVFHSKRKWPVKL